MGYLAENLAYFMAEAVDRNGKKDPSLGMKHPNDFVNKYKNIDNNAFDSMRKAEKRHDRISQTIKPDDGGWDASVRMAHHKYECGADHRMNNGSRSKNGYVNASKCYTRHANSAETDYSTHSKLMTRDAKKAHNESALFNDPIWDEL